MTPCLAMVINVSGLGIHHITVSKISLLGLLETVTGSG